MNCLKLSRVVTGVLFFGLCVGSAFVHGQNSSGGQTASEQSQGNPAQAVVDEIDQIRNQLGGGVAQALSGLISPEEANKEFRDEIRRQEQTRHPDRWQGLHDLPVRAGRQAFARPAFADSGGSSAAPAENQVHQLRNAARRLEELAADFEDVELFAEADGLRLQAGKFWLRARNATQSPSNSMEDFRSAVQRPFEGPRSQVPRK